MMSRVACFPSGFPFNGAGVLRSGVQTEVGLSRQGGRQGRGRGHEQQEGQQPRQGVPVPESGWGSERAHA